MRRQWIEHDIMICYWFWDTAALFGYSVNWAQPSRTSCFFLLKHYLHFWAHLVLLLKQSILPSRRLCNFMRKMRFRDEVKMLIRFYVVRLYNCVYAHQENFSDDIFFLSFYLRQSDIPEVQGKIWRESLIVKCWLAQAMSNFIAIHNCMLSASHSQAIYGPVTIL